MKPMWKRVLMQFLLFLAALVLAAACSQKVYQVKSHPMELETAPSCSECHTDDRSSLDHTEYFSRKGHGNFAVQGPACYMCHRESFCSDCHADKEELKPSDKFKDRPDRFFQHRGDYITQHKIDGKIDPARCFGCHGRTNNERCRACHK